jgi:hypothetical protein
MATEAKTDSKVSTASAVPAGSVVNSSRLVADRWTPNLARGGWTPIADFFLDNYHRLPKPLKYSEAMFVIHVMRHKWDKNAPYPAFKTIATRMGLTPEAARLLARSLEKKGYLHRQMRVGQTNRFHFNSLFAALEQLMANDAIEKIAKQRREDQEVAAYLDATLASAELG